VVAAAISHYRSIHRLFEIEEYEPDDIVFREGDLGECAYFIHSGEVEVIRSAPPLEGGEGREEGLVHPGKSSSSPPNTLKTLRGPI